MKSLSAKTWSLDQMLRMLEKGTMTYSNIYQRSYVWDHERECNLVASYIEGYDIPAITANSHTDEDTTKKKKSALYDLLNGKQRLTCSERFKNNQIMINGLRKLKLNPEDAIDLTDEEKELLHYMVDDEGREVIDINGMYFKDLPPILQKVILGRMIRIEYHENMTRDEERQTIINANSGKGMTTAEMLRVEMVSFEQILRLSKHPVFRICLSDKAIAGYWNEKLVEQIYAMLHMDEPSLDQKAFRPFIREAVVNQEQEGEINAILDRFLEIFEIVNERNPKIAKTRILGKTHMVSTARMVKRSLDEIVPVEIMARWMEYFFSGKKRASVNETYNEWANRNTAQRQSVEKRLTEVEKSYVEFVVGGKEIPEVELPKKPAPKKGKEEVIRTVVSTTTEESAEESLDEAAETEDDEKVVRTVVTEETETAPATSEDEEEAGETVETRETFVEPA